MPPPNRVLIFSGPGSLLILRIADNPDGSILSDRKVLHCPRLGTHKYKVSSYRLALVIVVINTFSDVDQSTPYLSALAVFRQRYRLCLIVGNLPKLEVDAINHHVRRFL